MLSTSFFFFCVPSYISEFHHFGWGFCVCDRFFNPAIESHILSSWMVHAGCVFVAGIHLSRTWTSGSFESMQCNACVHRLDLGLYSHWKGVWGNGVRICVYSMGKLPSIECSEENRSHNAASCRTASPTHYWVSCSGPMLSTICCSCLFQAHCKGCTSASLSTRRIWWERHFAEDTQCRCHGGWGQGRYTRVCMKWVCT